MQKAGGLSLPTAKVEGRPPNAFSLQWALPSKADYWGSFDDDAETHPEKLALKETTWARGCCYAPICNN